MATVILGSTPTTIDLAEATTNWVGDTFSLEPDIKVQGSNSIACAQTGNGVDTNQVHVSGSWDFSTVDEHLRLWFNISFIGNLATSNAIQVFISDGTNYSYWTITQSGTYAGGWSQAIIYTGDTPTRTSGTVDKSAITQIGMNFNTATKPRNVPANSWFDAWRYGDGYYCTGGTSGDEITPDLIAAADLVQAYGIFVEINGAFFARGDIQIGNGSTTTWFLSDGDIIIFPQEAVNAGLYRLAGDGTGSRVSFLETVIKADGTATKDKFDFDMSESNLLSCSVVAAKLTRAALVNFKIGQTIADNKFVECASADINGATFDDNTISNATLGADYLAAADGDDVERTNYADNTTALKIAVVENYTLDGDTFSGNTYDIENADNAATITAGSFTVGRAYKILTVGTTNFTLIGSADNSIGTKFVATGIGAGTGTATEVLLINATNGANPSIAKINNSGTNADILILNAKTFSFTLSPSLTGYEWRIYEVTALGSLAGSVEKAGEETATADNQSYDYNYTADQPIAVQIIDLVSDVVESITYYTLGNGNQDVTIPLTEDINN